MPRGFRKCVARLVRARFQRIECPRRPKKKVRLRECALRASI